MFMSQVNLTDIRCADVLDAGMSIADMERLPIEMGSRKIRQHSGHSHTTWPSLVARHCSLQQVSNWCYGEITLSWAKCFAPPVCRKFLTLWGYWRNLNSDRFSADGKFEVSFKANVLIYPGGMVMWIPCAIYKSSCDIDVKYFPFDEQSCDMTFGSWTYDGEEVDLIPYTPGFLKVCTVTPCKQMFAMIVV
jgi:Neurotransmitter-gated ion-channel ligand binding domain